jgi:hypothetical protein
MPGEICIKAGEGMKKRAANAALKEKIKAAF